MRLLSRRSPSRWRGTESSSWQSAVKFQVKAQGPPEGGPTFCGCGLVRGSWRQASSRRLRSSLCSFLSHRSDAPHPLTHELAGAARSAAWASSPFFNFVLSGAGGQVLDCSGGMTLHGICTFMRKSGPDSLKRSATCAHYGMVGGVWKAREKLLHGWGWCGSFVRGAGRGEFFADLFFSDFPRCMSGARCAI